MSPATRARKIARVHQLAQEGTSNRIIATKVGISEATVRRWRRTTSASDDAPDDAPACDTGATHDAVECVTAASPAASPDAPECVTDASSPASEPDHLTVPLDADMRDHLAVLTEAGDAPADAVTRAVELLADAYRGAWDYGLYQRGQRPDIRLHVKGDMPPPNGW